jgi:endonuclease G
MGRKKIENAPLQSLLRDAEVLEELQGSAAELSDAISRALPAGYGEPIESTEPIVSLERMLENREVTPGLFSSVEAIVLTTGRPALLIQGGEWERPRLQVIRDRLEPAINYLKEAIPKVGRVELLNDPTMAYVGTGWMIDEDVMITNRHVANTFAFRSGSQILMRTTPFGAELQVQTDFNEEYESPNPPFEVGLVEVLFIEENGYNRPDMALIRLEKVTGLPEPVELSPLRVERDDDIVVIGYPARDSGRNDPFVMSRIFNNIYNVKRLSPGRISGIREDRFILTHDCTTLGGNSGSLVLNLKDGKAAGLHFAGSYKDNNFAVTSETLREKLIDLAHRSVVSVSASFEQEKVPSQEDLETRTGYNTDFLPETVPFPEIDEAHSIDISPVNGRDDGRLHYLHFSVVIHKTRRLALYTACNIDGETLFSIHRGRDKWNFDPRMGKEFQVGNELYKRNALDRGHLVRRLDPAWGSTREEASQAADDTFFYTNAHPQHSKLNQRSWLRLEDYLLDNAITHKLKISVFTGPVFDVCDREYRNILIPKEYWKVVVLMNEFTGRLSATGYLLSQAQFVENLEFVFGAYETYQVPIKTLEKKTGLIFGDLITYDPLNVIEGISSHIINSSSDLIV